MDESFPLGQFSKNNFSSPFRLYGDTTGGSVLLYIKEYIPSKHLSVENATEAVLEQINLLKEKWLIIEPKQSAIK